MEAHEGITTEDLRLFYSSQPSFSVKIYNIHKKISELFSIRAIVQMVIVP